MTTGPRSWLCLLFLPLLPAPLRACPAPCQCSAENRTVECGDRKLPAAPRGFPAGTRRLDLSRNLIRSVGRADWSRPPGWARRLEELDLAHNLLAQLEPGAFVGLDRLRALGLRGNRLRYLEPGSLRGLASLHSLDLTQNPLVALLDRGLAGPSALRLLALGAPTLVHIGPQAFSGLGQLGQLTVTSSGVEQAPGLAMSPLANLTVLRLQGLAGPRTLPPGWLEGLGRLRALELDGWASLREIGPGALQGVSLVWLSVTRANLSEVPYLGLRLQSQLRFLNLSYNPITLIRRGQLHHLARLQELRLRGAALLEVEIWAFRGLPTFRLLDLTANRLASLEQRAFHSVAGLQSLGLGLNPLACDCRLLWAVRRRRRLLFIGPGPVCASPPAVRGLRWAGEEDRPMPAAAFRCRVPVIRGKTPRQRLQAREAQTAALRCLADGLPRPNVVWINPRQQPLVPGRGPLAGPGAGRSSLLPDGTLLIAGVRPSDAGTYRCVARNAAGNDSALAVLSVRPLSAHELSLRPVLGPDAGLGPNPGLGPDLGLASSTLDPLLRHALGRRAVLVATSLGLSSFLGTVTVCFGLLLAWSRLCGPIKHSTHIEFVPHDGGDGGNVGGDGKFNMKMV